MGELKRSYENIVKKSQWRISMLDFGFYNMDCMDGMKEFPDKYFDLAIVDPPYGSGGKLELDNEQIRGSV